MDSNIGSPRFEAHDWKCETEMLRAECNFLRMEKEVAVRMWEQSRHEMEHMAHSMQSALHNLFFSGRKKIVDEKNAGIVLQSTLRVEMQILQNRLQKLRKNSEIREKELKNKNNEQWKEKAVCSEICRETIRNILEQVEAETEQWSQLERILGHLHHQIHDLQESKDLWEDHAVRAHRHMPTLLKSMHEWRHRARSSQKKVSHLQSEIAHLKNNVQHLRVQTPLSSQTIMSAPMYSDIDADLDTQNLQSCSGSDKREKIDRPSEDGSESISINSFTNEDCKLIEKQSGGRPLPNECAEKLVWKKSRKKKENSRAQNNGRQRSVGISPLTDLTNIISPIRPARSGFPIK